MRPEPRPRPRPRPANTKAVAAFTEAKAAALAELERVKAAIEAMGGARIDWRPGGGNDRRTAGDPGLRGHDRADRRAALRLHPDSRDSGRRLSTATG